MNINDLKSYLGQNISNTKPAMESFIQPQFNDKFVDELIQLIGSRYDMGDKYFKDDLEELFNKRFNIKINFILSNTYASFCLPMVGSALGDISKDNFLFRMLANELKVNYIELKKEYEKIKSDDVKIDLKNAKIYGYESKYNYIYIDINMFKEDYILNNREIAAVIMHEMGHIFTHIYYTAHIFRNSFNLIESLQIYSNGELTKAKELIITSKDSKNNDYKVVFKRQLEDYKTLLDKYAGVILGMQGSDTLNKVSEIEADEFSTKFGLGDALTTSLKKLMVDEGYNAGHKGIWGLFGVFSTIFFIYYLLFCINFDLAIFNSIILAGVFGSMATVELLLITSLFIIILSAIFKLLSMSGINITMFRYDKIKPRLERIKRNAIKMLRTYKLDKDALDKIILTIDTIEKSIKGIEKTFVNTNLGSIIFADINNYGSIDNVDELFDIISDRLVNNDFHYLAEKVKK